MKSVVRLSLGPQPLLLTLQCHLCKGRMKLHQIIYKAFVNIDSKFLCIWGRGDRMCKESGSMADRLVRLRHWDGVKGERRREARPDLQGLVSTR